MDKFKLKKCPICGGRDVKLHKFHESIDGRGDRHARISCSCGLELGLTFDEFDNLRDKFGYTGGYYSQCVEFWEGMHQALVDKWNNMACANVGDPNNHNVTAGDLMDILKGIDANTEIVIPVIDQDDANKIYGFRYVRTVGILHNTYEKNDALCINSAENGMDLSDQITLRNDGSTTYGNVFI